MKNLWVYLIYIIFLGGFSACAADFSGGRISGFKQLENGDITISYGADEKTFALKDFDPTADPYKPVATDMIRLAPDGRTLGWAVEYENCCTSYSIPLILVIYRDGRILRTIDDGMMIWDWAFRGGTQVVLQTGPTHGDACIYGLYDIASGKQLDEAPCNNEESDTALPAWTRPLNVDHSQEGQP